MGGWDKLAAQTAVEVLKSRCSKMIPKVEKHRKAGAGRAPTSTTASILLALACWRNYSSMMPSMIGPQKRGPDFDEYAKNNLYGGRNKPINWLKALKSPFKKAKDDMRLRCAAIRSFTLLVQAKK